MSPLSTYAQDTGGASAAGLALQPRLPVGVGEGLHRGTLGPSGQAGHSSRGDRGMMTS